MKARTRRLLSYSIVLVALSAILIWAHGAYREILAGMDYLTGWALLAVIAFLAIYNGRKKLPFLPLVTASPYLRR